MNGRQLSAMPSCQLNDRKEGEPFGRSPGRHDWMFKSHKVEQPLDRGILRIGAARPDIPIAVGMRVRVAHDYLSRRPPPRL
jgi:hypothetical protein